MKLDGDVKCLPAEEAAIWAELLDVLRRHNATFWGWAEVWDDAAEQDIVDGNGEWPREDGLFRYNGEHFEKVDVSPQGHAVMEDLAKYEAMHTMHNSPELRLTE